MRSDKDVGVIRVAVNYPIAFSCHIRCRDGLHQGAFHTLSDIGRPLVFNNSCSSSHELAPMFVDAGARAYVGTLWDVGNDTATRAAKTFYTKALKDGNLSVCFLRNGQANDAEEGRQRVYLVGVAFQLPAEAGGPMG